MTDAEPTSSLLKKNSSSGAVVLEKLPLELFPRLIFPFLDPRSLSTFYVSIVVDRHHLRACEATLRRFVSDELKSMFRSWRASLEKAEEQVVAARSNKDDASIVRRCRLDQVRVLVQRAVDFVQAFLQEYSAFFDNDDDAQHPTLCFSKATILLDALGMSQQYLCSHSCSTTTIPNQNHHLLNHINRLVEAPIWCGRIQVLLWVPRGNYHGFRRILLQARVALLSPIWNRQSTFDTWEPLLPPQNNDSNDDNDPALRLIVESYNFLPTLPIGRMVGLRPTDRSTLQTIAHRLEDQNTVAILSPQQQSRRMLRQVLLLSRTQARERAKMPRMPFCYYAKSLGEEDNRNDLICCWQQQEGADDNQHQDTTTTIDSAMDHWQRILKVRDVAMALEEDDSEPQEFTSY
ncbi:expressed unknown protein [Seminavis robusta]|uniref:Uncharacterized protein n=1 Tax=Seminavis robusta TaxID=568900 RepID=A0A9N8DJC5_9STRA|nr:expressed unknown protein [Seminavis robusta]|eukprot:Sro118_g057860.1 n/a (404) ;mRNA; r:91908-93119